MSTGMIVGRNWRFRFLVSSATLGVAAFFLTLSTTFSRSGTMALPGQLSVGQAGAATYSIPIALPPGTAGMAPTLSLDYSSSGGDGFLGVGWSLSGLPSVGRCPRTKAQDGGMGGVNF